MRNLQAYRVSYRATTQFIQEIKQSPIANCLDLAHQAYACNTTTWIKILSKRELTPAFSVTSIVDIFRNVMKMAQRPFNSETGKFPGY